MSNDLQQLKPILIAPQNRQIIADLLNRINGNATTHTYSDFDVIIDQLRRLDQHLASIGLNAKKAKIGLQATLHSGTPLPKSYKYTVLVNRIKIVYKAKGWYIVKLDKMSRFGGGDCYLILTQAQDAIAVKHLRSSYAIAN